MTIAIETSRAARAAAIASDPTPSGTKPATDQVSHDTQVTVVGGTQLADSHWPCDTQARTAAGANFTTGHRRTDVHSPSAGGDQTSRGDHPHRETHTSSVDPAQTSDGDQPTHDDQIAPVAVGPNLPPGQVCTDTQDWIAGRDQTSSGHGFLETHPPLAAGPTLRDPVLGVLADVLDDLENVRIANENRLRTLTADDEYGHGLTLAHPEIARLAAIVDVLKDQEHQAQLNLCRVMRRHPLWEFAKPLKGVGEKQFARLIAVVGDPYWSDLHDRPRTVSELRSYCGFGDPQAQRRQRGQKSNWNTVARSRVWLIAESCMKQKEAGQYRKAYDAARIKYADAVHDTECKRCGPAGKPAQPGSPLSLAHQHARGLRAIAKQLLKDLWLAAEAHRQEIAA